MTPVTGSTLHAFFAVRHKRESGSLSQGPSSHILSILVLSSSLHLPSAAAFSKSASPPGQVNLLSVWHLAVSSMTRGCRENLTPRQTVPLRVHLGHPRSSHFRLCRHRFGIGM